METLTYSGVLQIKTCWCGIRHAVPRELVNRMRIQQRNGERLDSIYCPLGHTWVFSGETELERVQRRLERAENRTTATLAQLDQEQASHRATKGHLTRAKRRAAAGVCQWCNRSFENVARHVGRMHPEHLEVD